MRKLAKFELENGTKNLQPKKTYSPQMVGAQNVMHNVNKVAARPKTPKIIDLGLMSTW